MPQRAVPRVQLSRRRATFHPDASSGEELYICDTRVDGRGAAVEYEFASSGGAQTYRAFDRNGAGNSCRGRFPDMVEGRHISFRACLSNGRRIVPFSCSDWKLAAA